MSEALGIAVTVAGLVWLFIMARAMLGIMRLAPSGRRWEVYNRLGMWNFGAVRAVVGTGAEPHLSTIRRGAYVFAALFLAILAVAAFSAMFRQASASTGPEEPEFTTAAHAPGYAVARPVT